MGYGQGVGYPVAVLWMLTDQRTAFHNHQLGPAVKHGFHALALDETRDVFEPVLWESPPIGWAALNRFGFAARMAILAGRLAL